MAYLRSKETRRPDEPAFVFAPDRCTGCEACRIACGIENGDGADLGWREVHTLNPGRHPASPTRHLSLACNHCEHPACMLGCPAAAYRRDETTGAVILDPDKCIGCHYCSWVCPYDAPRYDEAAGTMSKCTFCNHRLEQGLEPACIDACPTEALTLGTRADAVGEGDGSGTRTGPGLLDWGFGPALAVREAGSTGALLPPRSGGFPSKGSSTAGRPLPLPRQPVPPRKIRLSAEWALLLFTLAIPALLAWLAAGLVRPEAAPSPWAFLAGGAVAMGASTLHLGRPLRAWRAVLNLRTSPLSREIALASSFLGAGTAHLLLPAGSAPRTAAGLTAFVLGIGALVAIDSVYRAIPRSIVPAGGASGSTRPSSFRLHSADAWLTGALLIGFAIQLPAAWAPAALIKLVLTMRDRPDPAPMGAPLLVLRLVLLAAAGLLALTALPWQVPFAVALAGEALDRAGFYRRLEPASPARTMAAQLTAAAQ